MQKLTTITLFIFIISLFQVKGTELTLNQHNYCTWLKQGVSKQRSFFDGSMKTFLQSQGIPQENMRIQCSQVFDIINLLAKDYSLSNDCKNKQHIYKTPLFGELIQKMICEKNLLCCHPKKQRLSWKLFKAIIETIMKKFACDAQIYPIKSQCQVLL